MIEAIARQYITGSMWRDYSKGGRDICGITIPDGLEKDTKLPELIITPSTKGILTGLPGVPEQDDVNVSPMRCASLCAGPVHPATACGKLLAQCEGEWGVR